MLTEKGRNILKLLSVKLENIIKKADKENEEWVQGSELPNELKKPTVTVIEEFEKEIGLFFQRQKKAYLNVIDNIDFSKKPVKKAAEMTIEELAEMISQYILVNNEHYVDVLTGIYEAFATKAIVSTAKIIGNSIKNTQIEPEISLTKKAVAWIDKTKIPFSKEVQQTTHDRIVSAIKESFSEHTGSQNVVNSMYKLYTEGKLDDFKKGLKQSIRNSDTFDWNRARTTARTEMMSVTNAGTLEGFRQSKVVKYKKWKCECGGRSRDTHIAADNIVVLADEPFVVGGYQLMHPGDRSLGAPAREIINCRCCMSGVPEALAHKYVPQYNPYKEKDVGTDEWLSRQSKEFQTGYLGSKEKQRLFSEGVLSIKDKDKTIAEIKVNAEIKPYNKDVIDADTYKEKFASLSNKNKTNTLVAKETKRCIKINDCTAVERVAIVEINSSSVIDTIKGGQHGANVYTDFSKYKNNSLILTHNHPLSGAFSYDDIDTLMNVPQIKSIVAGGHNGNVYILSLGNNGKRLDKSVAMEYNKLYKEYYDKDTIKVMKHLAAKYNWIFEVK